jgi:FkbM family methyltransferase
MKKSLFSRIYVKILLYRWKLQCLFYGDKIKTFYLIDGSRFDYPFNSALSASFATGGFEVAEVEFVLNSLKPGDIFVDIGANGGFYTVMAAKKIQSHGHIYAFEPDQRNLKLLKNNIAVNKITNVTIIDSAVSNEKGTAKFAIARDGALNSLANTNRKDQEIQQWEIVPLTTLDDFVKEFNVSRIDFMKVDAEGAEKQIFEGGKNTFSAQTNMITLFEATDLNSKSFGYTVKNFLEDISKSGLNLYYLEDNGTLQSVVSHNREFGGLIYNFICSNKELI